MKANQHKLSEASCDLRFGQVGLACVRIRRVDAAAVFEELEHRVRQAQQLFSRTAVVVDLGYLDELPDEGTVDALLEAVRSAGMLPVGLAYGSSENEALAKRMGLPLIARFRAAYEAAHSAPSQKLSAQEKIHAKQTTYPPAATRNDLDLVQGTLHHDSAVRSGQQIYARQRDLVVTGTVANGAEVIADGDIHIYGTLRGRAMAGAQGDGNARVFVSDFYAELVAIAGHYRVFEHLPDTLEGRAVRCWLKDDKLLLARL